MFQNIKKDNEGFTIIEVLIVLAIAGLIMLIVFLAVPALQRNQRNNARNSEASRVSAAVTECLANRNGDKTKCLSTGGNAVNIDTTTLGQLTNLGYADTTGAQPAHNTTSIAIWFGHTCDTAGQTAVTSGATSRSFALTYQLEPAIDRCIAS